MRNDMLLALITDATATAAAAAAADGTKRACACGLKRRKWGTW